MVIGADGFIGSHMGEASMKEGYHIKALVYYNWFSFWDRLDTFARNILDNIEIVSGDISEPIGVETAMQGCDFIFHLAALIAIPFPNHSPDCYVDRNIRGTLNELQASRKLDVEKVLIAPASEAYGTA